MSVLVTNLANNPRLLPPPYGTLVDVNESVLVDASSSDLLIAFRRCGYDIGGWDIKVPPVVAVVEVLPTPIVVEPVVVPVMEPEAPVDAPVEPVVDPAPEVTVETVEVPAVETK